MRYPGAAPKKQSSLFYRLFPEFEALSFGTLFLILTSTVTALTVVMVLFTSLRVPLPNIIEHTLPRLRSSSTGTTRDAFLARLDRNHLRELASKVHFVSEIIRTTNRRVSPEAKKLAYAIVIESERAGYDPLFVASVIKAESTFRREARSHVGALGLMQLMPATGQYIAQKVSIDWQGRASLVDPNTNIQLGIAYLKYLEKLFNGDMTRVLVAYNWGPGHLENAIRAGNRPPGSVLKYASTILSTHSRWREEYERRSAQYQFMNPNYLFS